MAPPTETPVLDMQTQVWKALAHAKQKWLEELLAEPPKTSREAAQRMTWINRALELVKRGQAEIKYETALIDAYAEHLSAIQMTLMGAAEQNVPAARSGAERRG